MKLISVSLKNFRGYKNEVKVSVGDITSFIGKNDIGKSTILEALEIFFNSDIVSIERADLNVGAENSFVEILCEFIEFPEFITLDASAKTTLASEHLLSASGTLKILKRYDCSKS